MATKIIFCDAVNNYAFRELKKELPDLELVSTQQYDEIVRVGDAPIIVYSWVVNSIPEDWFTREDLIVYNIYSNSDEDIRNIYDVLVEQCFKDYEVAAERVNKFIDNYSSQVFSKFDYDYISLYSASAIEPAEEEGGRMNMVITLRVGYRRI